MAEGDRQLAFTTGPVPTSVQVSGADRITPKTVNASFDGTGAAGAFLPCLIITGRTGHEVARIPASQVAAGASAEVSWFPRVSAVAPTAGGGDYVFLAEQTTDVNNQIVFAAIPQTFRHLRLELSINTTNVGTPKVGIVFNIGGTVYASEFLFFGTGSGSVHRTVDDGQTYFAPLNYGRTDGSPTESRAFTIPSESEGSFASYVLEFPYYALSDRWARTVWQGHLSRSGFTLYTSGGGEWQHNGPVTDISIVAYSGTVGIGTPDAIGAGSIASLYGVT